MTSTSSPKERNTMLQWHCKIQEFTRRFRPPKYPGLKPPGLKPPSHPGLSLHSPISRQQVFFVAWTDADHPRASTMSAKSVLHAACRITLNVMSCFHEAHSRRLEISKKNSARLQSLGMECCVFITGHCHYQPGHGSSILQFLDIISLRSANSSRCMYKLLSPAGSSLEFCQSWQAAISFATRT